MNFTTSNIATVSVNTTRFMDKQPIDLFKSRVLLVTGICFFTVSWFYHLFICIAPLVCLYVVGLFIVCFLRYLVRCMCAEYGFVVLADNLPN